MKKFVLAVAIVALAFYGIVNSISPRQYSGMRIWMTRRPSSDVVVGVAWPFEANQDGLDNGLIMAQEEINARGLMGKRVRLLMRDDHMDREESRKIAIDFARDPRLVAVIGYYDDKFAVRASAILEESRLLHIVTGANNSYMTTHGFRYLIRSVLANSRIGPKLALMGVERGFHNFAIVAENGPFGEDLAYQTGIGLDALNAHVTYEATYVPAGVDFHDTVDALREAGADAVLLLGMEHESALFIRTAREMGLKLPILGAFSDTPEVRAIAGAALEGVMFYEIYNPELPTAENQAFLAKYRRRFGNEPGPYAAQGYDALRILAKAVETTHSTNPLDLSYAIRYMDRWEGANGSYKFDSTGELDDKDICLKVYHGGTPVVIGTSRTAGLTAPLGKAVNDLFVAEGGGK